MSDDEADPELLALLAKSLGLDTLDRPPEIPVLRDAEYIYNNSINVALDATSCRDAARSIHEAMRNQKYSHETWSQHELHPKKKDKNTVDFIFTMDLLNFCFWTRKSSDEQFAVEYRGKTWTGYWSLVACIQRGLDEGLAITSAKFWTDSHKCTDKLLRHIFRSSTTVGMPMLEERMRILREAGHILQERYEGSFVTALEDAGGSAAQLLECIVQDFPMFRDENKFENKRVRFYKRAQILIADLWAAFGGVGFGNFHDIDQVTVFADYRIPQILHSLGCLQYSPKLEFHINSQALIESGSQWELEIRGCTIWCAELIRREIKRQHEEADVNSVLIDFFLYDTCKSGDHPASPHHRTKSIWY